MTITLNAPRTASHPAPRAVAVATLPVGRVELPPVLDARVWQCCDCGKHNDLDRGRCDNCGHKRCDGCS